MFLIILCLVVGERCVSQLVVVDFGLGTGRCLVMEEEEGMREEDDEEEEEEEEE
jgi:hypothetical protein